MRRLTLALLCATYLCLALIVALTLWRNGGGWGAGVAALVGGLGLCFAFHGLIERALETGAMKGEIAAVRDAHAILLDQVEALDARLSEVVESATEDLRRSEELIDEVHLLESLVQRLQHRLDEQGDDAPLDLFPPHAGHDSHQASSLLETVRGALTDNRVDLFLQPVVSLPQRRTVYYESYSRLRDATGRVMMPAEFLAVAEPGGLITAIDNLLLFRCVQIVRRLARQDRRIGIFCNISMASIADEVFFPQFLELLTANRDLAGSLIFEIGQPSFNARGSVEARNMAKLADLGFRYSLDKVTDLDLDLQDLSRSDVKFLKVGAQFLLEDLSEVDGRLVLSSVPDLAAEDFAQLTQRYGVNLIVEKVESERQVAEILDLNVGFGQGHLFGEPRAIKEAVLAESAPPAPAPDPVPAFLRQPPAARPAPTPTVRRAFG
jgi:cyclic-di-GMP phosphodiesterase TipF (flagellum assembly factor)